MSYILGKQLLNPIKRHWKLTSLTKLLQQTTNMLKEKSEHNHDHVSAAESERGEVRSSSPETIGDLLGLLVMADQVTYMV